MVVYFVWYTSSTLIFFEDIFFLFFNQKNISDKVICVGWLLPCYWLNKTLERENIPLTNKFVVTNIRANTTQYASKTN